MSQEVLYCAWSRRINGNRPGNIGKQGRSGRRRGDWGWRRNPNGLGRFRGLFLGGRRGLLTGLENEQHLDGRVVLPVSLQAPIVLAAAEVLDINLLGGVIDDFAHHAHSFEEGLTELDFGPLLAEQHTRELDPGTFLGFTVIDADDIAHADFVLVGSIFKHGVHGGFNLARDLRSWSGARPEKCNFSSLGPSWPGGKGIFATLGWKT